MHHAKAYPYTHSPHARREFINFALLLGSDYTTGIKGVGIVNATEIMSAFPGPDGLQRFAEWMDSVGA